VTTTNDAMYEALVVAYPLAGATLGDLLYEFWLEKGLEYRGTLQYEFFQGEGAVGNTLGDLMNNYFSDPDFFLTFDIFSSNDILEYQVFDYMDNLFMDSFEW